MVERTAAPASDAVRASVCDVEEASALGGRVYHRARSQVLTRGERFCMHLNARTFGPLTVGTIGFDSPALIRTEPLEVGYQFNVPLGGHLDTVCGRARVRATPELASVVGPGDVNQIVGWGEGQSMLAVKVAREAFEQNLERLLGHRLETPLRVAPSLVLDAGPGAEVWRLLGFLVDQLKQPTATGDGSLIGSTPFGASLAESFVTGLLYAHAHNYSEELLRPASHAGTSQIRAAVAFIEERMGDPIDVADIAEHVGVGVRSLQQGFKKHLSTTPMTYLRELRLREVHRVLLAGDPAVDSVTTIAAAGGFFHLGRFAAQYRAAYGESPSQTLRTAASS